MWGSYAGALAAVFVCHESCVCTVLTKCQKCPYQAIRIVAHEFKGGGRETPEPNRLRRSLQR